VPRLKKEYSLSGPSWPVLEINSLTGSCGTGSLSLALPAFVMFLLISSLLFISKQIFKYEVHLTIIIV
jgi:hypothetical protein